MGGHHFGELAKITGVITYKLSPFELKAFPNIKHAIKNTIQRMVYTVPIFAPPFIAAFAVFYFGEQQFIELQRKNPDDYKNDDENGHDNNGHDNNGQDSNGHDSNGHNSNGHDNNCHDSKGRDNECICK